MKTLNEQIERLKELVRKCYGAVAGKNGTVPEVGERNMENLPAAIGSIISASDIPKIKVSSFTVANDCINEDGRWEGVNLIDTSRITNFTSTFENCTSLEYIDISQWNMSNAKQLNRMFLKAGIKRINLSNLGTSKVTTMEYMFRFCNNIEVLDLTGMKANSVTNINNMFYFFSDYCRSYVGDRELEDVINNNLKILEGLKVSVTIYYNTPQDRASLRALINGLADVTDQPVGSRPTLTLNNALFEILEEEDIAIANNKGWDVA